MAMNQINPLEQAPAMESPQTGINLPGQEGNSGENEDQWTLYKEAINALMQKVQAKYWELNALKFSGDNQNEAQKADIIKYIFDAMKSAGIDPSDSDSINSFLAELEQDNPDLYTLFVQSFNGLLWEEAPEQSPEQGAANPIQVPGDLWVPAPSIPPVPQSPQLPESPQWQFPNLANNLLG